MQAAHFHHVHCMGEVDPPSHPAPFFSTPPLPRVGLGGLYPVLGCGTASRAACLFDAAVSSSTTTAATTTSTGFGSCQATDFTTPSKVQCVNCTLEYNTSEQLVSFNTSGPSKSQPLNVTLNGCHLQQIP
ncbi:hypothetical protein TRVL_04683 [Trypanosoma vivax]|nr:hypothetical protein TRVL_04683 [Trypanosoma vivax]